MEVRRMRSSSWEYVGYVLVTVGCSLALTGTVALFSLQQGNLRNMQYSPYLLPILVAGIVFAVSGAMAFIKAGKKRKQEFPPPPPPPPL
jgi:hypothetical protein